MTDCAELRALVEKLADFEATAAEKLAAEAHLERCPSCRSHVEFLASLNAESGVLAFPEPPESYWEHLPRKVLARIDSEDRRPSGISRILLAPSVLRWGALGVTLVLVTALGATLLRESPESPAPAASAPAPATEARESKAQAPAEPIVSPPMARDEAAPAAAEGEALPDARKSDPASEDSQTPPPVAPAAAAFESSEAEMSSLTPDASAIRENAPVLERAARARSAAAPASPGTALEDCDALRRTVSALGSELASDARYRLALCSIERLEREATEELRTRAIEDAEAFLAGESDGSRSEEIREKLRRIR